MPRTSACHAGFVNYCGFDGDGDLPPRKDTHLWADEEMALQSATQTQLATPNIMYPAYNPMHPRLQPPASEAATSRIQPATMCIRGCNPMPSRLVRYSRPTQKTLTDPGGGRACAACSTVTFGAPPRVTSGISLAPTPRR